MSCKPKNNDKETDSMKTDDYTITGTESDITEINEVIEKVASYNDLPEKDKKKLQLL